jgi:hypothetical protein
LLQPIAHDSVMIRLPWLLFWLFRPREVWDTVMQTDGDWIKVGDKEYNRWIHVTDIKAWCPHHDRTPAIERYLGKNPDIPRSRINAPIVLSR